jgi:hypothetical protein
MHLSRSILWGLTACLAACGDLKVRSVAPTQTVPAVLEGLWLGTWQSAKNQTAGLLEIRIQQFHGEAVVEILIDNPCLLPDDYELILTADGILLRLGGETVMQADLLEDGQLVGFYDCALDDGGWQAEWVEGLPSLLDLSGSWEGRIYAIGQQEQPIYMTLEQSVSAGRLVLHGDADLPAAFPFGVPLEGYVRFGPDEFELTLFTPLGVEPSLYLTGVGQRETLSVSVGIVQVQGPATLPFSIGMVQLIRQE